MQLRGWRAVVRLRGRVVARSPLLQEQDAAEGWAWRRRSGRGRLEVRVEVVVSGRAAGLERFGWTGEDVRWLVVEEPGG